MTVMASELLRRPVAEVYDEVVLRIDEIRRRDRHPGGRPQLKLVRNADV